MDSEQLTYVLNTNLVSSVYFRGVFPSDVSHAVISKLETPWTAIFNTAPADHSGLHWIAIFCSKQKRRVEYFDPLGMSAKIYPAIEKLLSSINRNYYFNSRSIQSYTSDICGLYVALFCYYKALNYSFKKIINMYSRNNLYLNDCKTLHTFQKVFKKEFNVEAKKRTRKRCRIQYKYEV